MEENRRQGFGAAATIGADLVRRPEVTRRWTDQSACEGMSVGALARHLVSQWFNAERLLRAPAGDTPIAIWEHYERAAWVHAALDDEVNLEIRDGCEELAAEGPEAMLTLVARLQVELPDVLQLPRSGSVAIPWQGWSLT